MNKIKAGYNGKWQGRGKVKCPVIHTKFTKNNVKSKLYTELFTLSTENPDIINQNLSEIRTCVL